MSLSRTRLLGALVAAQAAHSLEEYEGRLWESFPPATFITALVSRDREFGFLVLNVAIVAFGLWSVLWPVRRGWPGAYALAWFWVALETINGIGHPVWALRQGEYVPGLVTAPILLALSLLLAYHLRREA